MAAVISGAKLIFRPDGIHFAMLQTPDAYTKSALDFLERK